MLKQHPHNLTETEDYQISQIKYMGVLCMESDFEVEITHLFHPDLETYCKNRPVILMC